MWLKYCVGLSMGLGFNGHYIQQHHNFRNKLHCTCIPYDSSKTSYNKNINYASLMSVFPDTHL